MPPTSAKHPKSTASKPGASELILQALAEALTFGMDEFARSKLEGHTGLKSKTLANAFTKLKQQGLITMTTTSISLTDAGKKKMGTTNNKAKTNDDRHEDIKSKLKGKQIVLFDLLKDGRTMSKDDLAQALDYENKSTKAFQNLVAAMKSKGICEYPAKDTVRLQDFCFPRGRPADAAEEA